MRKEEDYEKAIGRINNEIDLIKGDAIIPKMATIVAALKEYLDHFDWCGFFFYEDGKFSIGPYQGYVVFPTVKDTGTCGACVRSSEILIVNDVDKFDGYIRCVEETKAEILVPVIDPNGEVIAVFNGNSSKKDVYDDVDKVYLEKIMGLLF